MIKNLKLRSNKKFYEKNIVKNLHRETSNSKIKSVLVLIDEVHREKIDLYELAKKLNTNKVNIKALLYRKFDKQQEFSPDFFSEKDFGFFGSLKSNNLKDFVKNSPDLLISYAIEPNLHLNMITLLSEAKFKIGFGQIDDRLFNLVISEPSFNFEVFDREIQKYLTILNKL